MKHMDQASLDAEQQREARDLHRGLKDRHVQLIALGGAIGVGLFLGSGRAISQAGPGLIFAYAAGGIVIFFIMRALGELLLHRPVAGSFATYAEEYVSPFAGFATGWSYWFMWVVTGMAEITAVAIYTTYWFPDMPQWIPALIDARRALRRQPDRGRAVRRARVLVRADQDRRDRRAPGRRSVVMLFNLGPAGETATVANLWQHGGIFPTGVLGVVLSLQIVMFAFQGVELIGVTAGEVEDPEKSLPRATNAVVYRILIFYIGALIVIMSVMPWTELHAGESPFVMVFAAMGVPAAAGIINFVVITAAASSCNGGLFSTGRMLYTLAQFGQAPRAFGKVSGNHVPAIAITASAACMLIGVVLNYFIPEQVFVYVTSVALVGSLWTWALIVIAHLGYRRAVERGEAAPVSFRMPGAPYTNWLVLIFLVGDLPRHRREHPVAIYVAPIWFALLGLGYYLRDRSFRPHDDDRGRADRPGPADGAGLLAAGDDGGQSFHGVSLRFLLVMPADAGVSRHSRGVAAVDRPDRSHARGHVARARAVPLAPARAAGARRAAGGGVRAERGGQDQPDRGGVAALARAAACAGRRARSWRGCRSRPGGR